MNEKGNPNTEVQKRIGECTGILNKLGVFWKHGDCSFRTKLQVYDAVVRAKLMYGLETVALNKTSLNKLNAFQMRGLRRILGMKSTFVDRSATNAKVMEMANQKLSTSKGKAKTVKVLSEFHRDRRVTLLAKILALGRDDQGALATLDPDTLEPHDHGKRRVGRPRSEWLKQSLDEVWDHVKQKRTEFRYSVLDTTREAHRAALRETAAELMKKTNS